MWRQVSSPTLWYIGFTSVALSGSNEGWAVGNKGTILRLSGGTWSEFSSPTWKDLYAVALSAPNDGWAVGSTGTVLRLRGGTWSAINYPKFLSSYICSTHWPR